MVMMVLDDGQYYCVSLCEEKCSILVSFVLLLDGDPSANHRIELLNYFQYKLDEVMEDFMSASRKAEAYIPCCYCPELHFKLKLLHKKRKQHCPYKMQPIPKECYDLITDQGLYYDNLINLVIGLLFLVTSVYNNVYVL